METGEADPSKSSTRTEILPFGGKPAGRKRWRSGFEEFSEMLTKKKSMRGGTLAIAAPSHVFRSRRQIVEG